MVEVLGPQGVDMQSVSDQLVFTTTTTTTTMLIIDLIDQQHHHRPLIIPIAVLLQRPEHPPEGRQHQVLLGAVASMPLDQPRPAARQLLIARLSFHAVVELGARRHGRGRRGAGDARQEAVVREGEGALVDFDRGPAGAFVVGKQPEVGGAGGGGGGAWGRGGIMAFW